MVHYTFEHYYIGHVHNDLSYTLLNVPDIDHLETVHAMVETENGIPIYLQLYMFSPPKVRQKITQLLLDANQELLVEEVMALEMPHGKAFRFFDD